MASTACSALARSAAATTAAPPLRRANGANNGGDGRCGQLRGGGGGAVRSGGARRSQQCRAEGENAGSSLGGMPPPRPPSRLIVPGSPGFDASYGTGQGLTLAHFRAQLEDLQDISLTLELNLSTFGTHPALIWLTWRTK